MLRISFHEKSRHSQPVATQIEVVSTPLSLAALLAATLLAGLFFVLLLTVGINALPGTSDPRFWHQMIDTNRDDQAHVMGKVLSGDAAGADIVILGTSATREALLVDDQLNQKIALRRSLPLSIVNLASSAQSPIESLFLVDAMAPQAGQEFVLFVSISSLRQDHPFNRLERGGFMHPPEALIQKYAGRDIFPVEWQSHSKRLLYKFRAARSQLFRLVNFRLKYWFQENIYGHAAPPYSPYLYIGQPSAKPETKHAQINTHRDGHRRQLSTNLMYLKNTIDVLANTLNQRNCRLVIASPPEFNREMRGMFPNESRLLNDVIQGLRAKHQIELVDFNDAISWSQNDFVDLTHVTQSGRDKWSEALLTWLSSRPARAVR
jgi:hypothetical protein